LKSYDPNQSAGWSETERQENAGPAISMPSFELGNLGGPVVQVAAVLLIAGALNAGTGTSSTGKRNRSSADPAGGTEESRTGRHQGALLERQRQADAYKRRVDVIDQLRNNQPVRSACSP
jgi:hypothetical protein